MLIEQGEQRALRHLQQPGRAFGIGIVGARLAVEQGNLAEPVGRLDQAQQGLLALTADRAHADRALQHGIQAAGRVAATEQALAGAQLAQAGLAEQGILQGGGQVAEPVPGEQLRAQGGGSGHRVSWVCRLADRGSGGHGAIIDPSA
ncbi:hypothetical protein D3C84_819500 [compost metagenome]